MELRSIANFVKPDNNINETNDVNEIIQLSKIVLTYVKVLIVTRGPKGVVTIKRLSTKLSPYHNQELDVKEIPTDRLKTVENVSGAGDCFASGFIHGVLLGLDETHCLSIGFKTAKQALLSKTNVPLKLK